MGASGGLTIGKTTGSVAVLLSEDPTEELLSAKITEFGLDDLIDFASDIAGVKLHHPPQEMLRFHTVDLYVSSGVRIGTTPYPKGIRFAASMDIFGKNASIDCTLDTELKIKGSVDEFQLGPLSVTGTGSKKQAIIDIELGRSTQHILVNGSVKFLEASALIDVEVEFLPHPKFKFDVELDFNKIFTFILKAEMRGSVDFHDTSNLNFTLYALLEQHLCEYVAEQAKNLLETARKAAAEGFDAAHQTLEKADKDFSQTLTQAQAYVEETRVVWDQKQAEVHAAFDRASVTTQIEIKRLQQDVTNAEIAYNAALEAAKADLRTARSDAAAAISGAQGDVRKAQRDGDADIDSHRRDVSTAEEDMRQSFGNALQQLEYARGDVAQKRGQLIHVPSKSPPTLTLHLIKPWWTMLRTWYGAWTKE